MMAPAEQVEIRLIARPELLQVVLPLRLMVDGIPVNNMANLVADAHDVLSLLTIL